MASSDDQILSFVGGAKPVFWRNDAVCMGLLADPFGKEVDDAGDRLRRSASLLRILFPSLPSSIDPLRSPMIDAYPLISALIGAPERGGRWWIKADHGLPIAGSIKARGGFHEVIALAERIAIAADLMAPGGDLECLAGDDCKELFKRYSVVVGSTGNLGMGIGLISSALGFHAVVHMSSDAKAWKKQRLRDHGATVIEHSGDYALAVSEGREAARLDRYAHFVDDEHSVDLFAGYAAAAEEVVEQLAAACVRVDSDHPLFVHIPCGVGGAPGGVAYGLKRIFGPDVHCLFAEPVQSPCMLVQLLHGDDVPVSVYDIGLSNRTEADGLAVGQASMLIAPLMRQRLDAIYTLDDAELMRLFMTAHDTMGLDVEPSAAACFAGPAALLQTPAGRAYLERADLTARIGNATHLLWTTGGSLLPEEVRAQLLQGARRASPVTPEH